MTLETAPELAQNKIVLLSVSVTLLNPGDTAIIAAGYGEILRGVGITNAEGKERALTQEELEGVALIATPAS